MKEQDGFLLLSSLRVQILMKPAACSGSQSQGVLMNLLPLPLLQPSSYYES